MSNEGPRTPQSLLDQLSAVVELDALPMQSAEVVEAFRAGFVTVTGTTDGDSLVLHIHVVTTDGLVKIAEIAAETVGFRRFGDSWEWVDG
jgi:hypothetical protein